VELLNGKIGKKNAQGTSYEKRKNEAEDVGPLKTKDVTNPNWEQGRSTKGTQGAN